MKTYIIDSFTNETFKGNPAGVCLVTKILSEELMLKIAQELGLSETAFVTEIDKNNSYSIRYFSPVKEIPLCGHATLASAKVLFERNKTMSDINFKTIEEIDLLVKKEGDFIKMQFPIYKTLPATAPDKLLDALGLTKVIKVRFNVETQILLIEIAEAKTLKNLSPDFPALIKSHDSIEGVLVTAPSDDNIYDFHSRYFWPWVGTNEDPVTGATHTFLAKYWGDKLSKTKMKSYQSSARSGFMEVELIDDSTLTISGAAIIILEGDLRV